MAELFHQHNLNFLFIFNTFAACIADVSPTGKKIKARFQIFGILCMLEFKFVFLDIKIQKIYFFDINTDCFHQCCIYSTVLTLYQFLTFLIQTLKQKEHLLMNLPDVFFYFFIKNLMIHFENVPFNASFQNLYQINNC